MEKRMSKVKQHQLERCGSFCMSAASLLQNTLDNDGALLEDVIELVQGDLTRALEIITALYPQVSIKRVDKD